MTDNLRPAPDRVPPAARLAGVRRGLLMQQPGATVEFTSEAGTINRLGPPW
jgi:hypothetical protein